MWPIFSSTKIQWQGARRAGSEVFRDVTLSHMIHHRDRLSVYLRLLGAPVPGSHGPTADERG
jgi:hypothetical protein